MIVDLLFPKELRRLSYFLRVVPWNCAIWTLTAAGDYWRPDSGMTMMELLGALVLVLYGVFFILLPRTRDAGMPGWLLVLAFVPYLSSLLSLVLLFKSSRSGLRFQGHSPTLEATPATVPGSFCFKCGERLMLASDGKVTDGNQVICHSCAVLEEPKR